MNRDEIIEFVRLSIEDFEETFDEIEGAAYSFLDGAALMAKDNLQMLTERPLGSTNVSDQRLSN